MRYADDGGWGRRIEFTGTQRFELLGQIGRGGMGVVYEAYDRERDMTVALKTLAAVQPDHLLRLKREFRSLTTVEHQNVVALYDLVSEGRDLFFTMELVEGIDFLAYVTRASPRPASTQSQSTRTGVLTAEGPLLRSVGTVDGDGDGDGDRDGDRDGDETAATAVSTARKPLAEMFELGPAPSKRPFDVAVDRDRLYECLGQLVTAIAALHERNVIHCDLKPSNVMVTPDGRVVVLDFGIASQQSQRGDTRMLAGTPAYMAPEQCEGKVDFASDWYGLGVMLFQAIAGTQPFVGNRDQIVAAKLSRPPRSVHEYVDGGPADLLDLCDALLRRDPADRPTATAIARCLGGSSVESRGPETEVFVGRQAELDALAETFDAAGSQPAAALLAGPSGMGKSTLAEQFLTSLTDSDLLLLEGRCREREQLPFNAFDPLVDSLAGVFSSLGDELEGGLPRDFAALARLFPVLEPYVPEAERGDRTSSPDQTRVSAVSALRSVLARLASTRRLVLVIDDLQWADHDSLALLSELCEQPGAPPVFWLLTARDEHLTSGSPTATALDTVSAHIGLRRIALPPLAAEERHELADALAIPGHQPDDKVLEWLAESGGNPMLITELVRFARDNPDAGAADNARSIDDILRLRVGALPPDDRTLLELTAVASEPTAVTTLARAMDMTGEDAARCLRRLGIEGLVRTAETGAETRVVSYHDRVREAIVAALLPTTAASHHRALASSLGDVVDARPDRVARHWLAAAEPQRAHPYLVRAAQRAVRQLAFDRATALYRQALDTPELADDERVDLLAALAASMRNTGRIVDAAATYTKAAALVDGDRRLDYRRLAAEHLLTGGYLNQGIDAARSVLTDVGLTMPSSSAAAIPALLGHQLRMAIRKPRLSPAPPESRDTALAATRADVCWSIGCGLSMVDSYRGLLFNFRTLHRSLKLGDPARSARSCGITAGVFYAMGNMRSGDALLAIADQAAELDPSPLVRVYQLLGRALRAYTPHNQWRLVLSNCQEALALWEEAGRDRGWEIDCADQFIAWTHMYLGQLPEMDRGVRRHIRAAQLTGNRFLELGLRARMVLVHLMRDQPEQALQDSEEAVAAWLPGSSAFQMQHYYGFVGQCESLAYAGRTELTPVLHAQWRDMKKFPLLLARIEGMHARARIALLQARAATGSTQRKLLAQIERWARYIGRQKPAIGTSWEHLLRAGVAHVRGDAETECAELEAAIIGLDALDTELYAAAARYRLGQVLGGDEGQTLVTAAGDWMGARRVTSPRRMARMLAPPWD